VRIVHIITRLIIGGAQENTLLSCEGQHARGHEVTLITGPPIGPEGSLMDRAGRGGYRVIVVGEMLRALGARKDFQTYRRLGALRDQSRAANIGVPGQYLTVYSGMETGPFLRPTLPRDVTRRNLGLRDEHVVVGTIARLFELKGHDDLLDLAPQLCRQHPNLR